MEARETSGLVGATYQVARYSIVAQLGDSAGRVDSDSQSPYSFPIKRMTPPC